MKCPSCGKPVSPRSKTCKHCQTRFIRKSDRMTRRFTIKSGTATAIGCALLLLAAILAYDGVFFFAGLSAAVGIVLVFLGNTMA